MPYALDRSSTLHVWTYKAGLLARMAHDLCLRATELEAPTLQVDQDEVAAEVAVPVASLRVQGQVKRGEVIPLRAKEHGEIEENVRGPHVLDVSRSPEVRYRGRGRRTGDEVALEGELVVQGRPHALSVTSRLRDEGNHVLRVEGEVELRQTALGLTPYSALGGSLKVQDRVRVSWSLLLRPA